MFAALLVSPVAVQNVRADDTVINPRWQLKLPDSVDFDQAIIHYEKAEYRDALNIALQAAAKGNSDAQVMAAHIYHSGLTGAADYDKASTFYQKAAEQNHPDALVGLGNMALASQANLTPDQAHIWFSKAATLGREDAMSALSDIYLNGIGVEVDPEKAQYWLDKGGMAGNILPDRKMADNLFESDPVAALALYEQAAAKGDYEAAYIAALMYDENIEIKPDNDRMVELMQMAARGGHAAAQADYGLWVYQGRGIPRNIQESAQWFQKSAEGGDIEGMFLYAFTLAKGEGVDQSFENAYYWLLKSGQSGISDYDQDRQILRERLEANVDREILDKARARFETETNPAD